MDTDMEMQSSQMRKIPYKDLASLVERQFAIKAVEHVVLSGYEDLTYWLYPVEWITAKNGFSLAPSETGYVLKITNERNSTIEDFIDGQVNLLGHLARHGLSCPEPVSDLNGQLCSLQMINYKAHGETQARPHKHTIALFKYITGKTLREIGVKSDHMVQIGETLARFHEASASFSHKFFQQNWKPKWSLHSMHMVKHFVDVFPDEFKRRQVHGAIDQFLRKLDEIACNSLPQGIIHGDFNTMNILVNEKIPSQEISGFLDVGDSHYGYLIFDLAVAITYVILDAADVSLLHAGRQVVNGYCKVRQLTTAEKQICIPSVIARLCQSLTYGYHTWTLNPTMENQYVLDTEKNGWTILGTLLETNNSHMEEAWFGETFSSMQNINGQLSTGAGALEKQAVITKGTQRKPEISLPF